MSIGTISAQPGSEVKVPISIDENSGISSIKFTVKFNSTNLALTNISFPKNSGTFTSVPEPYTNNQTVNFVSPLASFNKTGLFATLTFFVKEDAEINKMEAISVEFEDDDIFDTNFIDVDLTVTNGSIYITDEIAENVAKLPANLITIADESFMDTSFSYVDLPETVTTIGSKAFANCKNLKYIYIPESTTKIAADAFSNDTNLIIMGKIGSYAQAFADNKGFVFQAR